MGLRDLIPTALVKVSDSDGFTVRGVSLNDALTLYNRHAGDLTALFDNFVEEHRGGARAKPVTPEKLTQVGLSMAQGAPVLLAEIIVIATDCLPSNEEFDAEVAAVMKFGTGVQMDALQKIANLTFTSDMPPGKFLAVVMHLAKSTTAASLPKAA